MTGAVRPVRPSPSSSAYAFLTRRNDFSPAETSLSGLHQTGRTAPDPEKDVSAVCAVHVAPIARPPSDLGIRDGQNIDFVWARPKILHHKLYVILFLHSFWGSIFDSLQFQEALAGAEFRSVRYVVTSEISGNLFEKRQQNNQELQMTFYFLTRPVKSIKIHAYMKILL